MRNPMHALSVLALGACILASSSDLSAQSDELQFPAASPPSLVRNQVGLTTVEIEYARPSARGRLIFGGLVPYGEIWRTGANQATRITFSTDVTFHDQQVEAGTYGLFTIPGEEQWTVILNAAPEQWGSYAYDEEQDVVRVLVDAVTLADPVETMRLGMDQLTDDTGLLTIEWSTARVQVAIGVDTVAMMVPKIEAAMSGPGDNKNYLGAAMFYYNHDLDLDKALSWIDAALEQQPQAVWVMYRKGLILAKMGNTEAARAAAEEAIQLADNIPGELGAEYRRLSEGLLSSLE